MAEVPRVTRNVIQRMGQAWRETLSMLDESRIKDVHKALLAELEAQHQHIVTDLLPRRRKLAADRTARQQPAAHAGVTP